MKFLIRIILPSIITVLLGYWLYFRLVKENIPFEEDKITYSIFGVITFISLIVTIVNISSFSGRCMSCKKWNALRVVSKELVDKKPSHKIKTLKEKNSKGEVIRTKEVSVPSTMYTYLVHKQCRFCEEITRYTTKENVEN